MSHEGTFMLLLSPVSQKRSSFATGVERVGQSLASSGKRSKRVLGSKTAPERIREPISEPFSRRQTERLELSCLSLQAEASPEGPPPTITTSYSIDSLSINYYFIPDKRSTH